MPQAGLKTACEAVLFDLDGTLIDSAPDLAGAGNDMRRARGLEPLPYERFRPWVGSGARGMLGIALQVDPGEPEFLSLRDEFLALYEARMTRETKIFDGITETLDALVALRVPWGIVTNKAARFAEPVVRALGLAPTRAALICGDTLARAKPFPDPLIEAARRLAVPPESCVYVGDDLRDVQAGRAASMATAVAAWGYLGAEGPVEAWGADCIIERPALVLNRLGLA